MIKALYMPEHSKDLMNLDKLTLPKLIWLIKNTVAINTTNIPIFFHQQVHYIYISTLISNITKNTFHS